MGRMIAEQGNTIDALQKEVTELAEYRRRYGALNGAKPTRTKVPATRTKVSV